jgi:hypothetical protein
MIEGNIFLEDHDHVLDRGLGREVVVVAGEGKV